MLTDGPGLGAPWLVPAGFACVAFLGALVLKRPAPKEFVAS
jgi:hypothetical protein